MKKATRYPVFLFIAFFLWLVLTGLSQQNSISHDTTAFPVQEKAKYIYIGMEKCASACHNNKDMGFQYNIVKRSPHANAFNILNSQKANHYAKKAGIKEDPQDSPVCLKCHVTGGGVAPTSFSPTYRKDEGVTCEACHKGEYITKTFIPGEPDCLNCHNNSIHKTSRFNYSEKLLLIAHKKPAAPAI